MNPFFLEKLLSQRPPGPAGVAISDVSTNSNNVQQVRWSKVLVIPAGLGKQVARLRDLGAVVFENVDKNYPEDSVDEFVTLVHALNPDLIVAGSRGTALVTEAFEHLNQKHRVLLLFGPTKLRAFFEARKTQNNETVIVHGVHDPNERIDIVRSFAHTNPKTRLVEVTTQGHALDIQTPHLRNVVKYALVGP